MQISRRLEYKDFIAGEWTQDSGLAWLLSKGERWGLTALVWEGNVLTSRARGPINCNMYVPGSVYEFGFVVLISNLKKGNNSFFLH